MKTPRNSIHPATPLSTIAVALFSGIFFICVPGHAVAQHGWDITLRPALNFPAKELAGSKLRTGFGFEGAFSYQFIPHLSAAIGWGWNVFSADESFAGPEVNFTETAYSLGIQFSNPIMESDFSYFAGAGMVVNYIDVENKSGSIISESKYGFGWQTEAGIGFTIGSFVVSPGVRYRASPRDMTIENTTTPIDLNYFSVGVGLTWAF